MSDAPRPALFLGFAGILPFVLFAILASLDVELAYRQLAVRWQLFYGAIVLVFVGAVHWGLALARFGLDTGEDANDWRFVWSIVPSFAAFAVFVTTEIWAFGILIAGFVAAFGVDGWFAQRGMVPPWYPKLRLWLTVIVVLSLGATMRLL